MLYTYFWLASQASFAQYEISGRLNNFDSLWQNKVYLALVDPDESYFQISENQIINATTLDKQGHFTLKGNNLPDESSIVRMYLVSNDNIDVEFSMYPQNYILLIVNNESKIHIESDNFCSDSLDYTVSGDFQAQNTNIKKLGLLLHSIQNVDENSYSMVGKGAELTREKKNNSLRAFCSSVNHPLVKILTIQNIDLESDYVNHPMFYEKLRQELKENNIKSSAYIIAFDKKLELIKFKTKGTKPAVAYKTITGILSAVILLLILYILHIKKENTRLLQIAVEKISIPDPEEAINQLTKREKEIVELLIDDYQNKEIAAILNLEVSTIKTHLSKIYQKLGVKNRNQAKARVTKLLNKD